MEVGDKAVGFKFKGGGCLIWNPDMERYIGEEGIITEIDDRDFRIQFHGKGWWYPLPSTPEVDSDIENNTNYPIY
jgi:hypothetical protein